MVCTCIVVRLKVLLQGYPAVVMLLCCFCGLSACGSLLCLSVCKLSCKLSMLLAYAIEGRHHMRAQLWHAYNPKLTCAATAQHRQLHYVTHVKATRLRVDWHQCMPGCATAVVTRH